MLTATSNEAAFIAIAPLDSLSVAAPVIDEVRPTASLCAGRNASFSRTRYPASEPVTTLHRPRVASAELDAALALAVLAVEVASVKGFARVDRPLLFLNLLLLMFVVLIPFPTDLLASYLHSGSDQHVAAAVYSGTLLVMGLSFAASWRYVASRGDLLTRVISQAELNALIRRNAVGQGV